MHSPSILDYKLSKYIAMLAVSLLSTSPIAFCISSNRLLSCLLSTLLSSLLCGQSLSIFSAFDQFANLPHAFYQGG